jgi:adenosylhomocysteine nucleosidase
MTRSGPIGILGAMPEEVAQLVEELGATRRTHERGGRAYHQGRLFGRDAVVVFSRWGKVAAAATATHLLIEHGVQELLFTGVAGGADPSLRVGDVVVASGLVQHDMDASPLFPRHEVPLLGVARFGVPQALQQRALEAARAWLARPEALAPEFGVTAPRAVAGEVASGDKFFAHAGELQALRARLPDVACVEMEGAAVAQVAYEYGVPLTVIRTLSDAADEAAPVDFLRFVQAVASRASHGIVRELLERGA